MNFGFAPLYADGDWWRRYLWWRLGGLGVCEAVVAANSGFRRRDAMRFAVEGGAVLSLPVAGGASALKNRPPDGWRLAAEAVRESRKMRLTLETLYGRTPFFHLLADEVLGCEADYLPGKPASEVCTSAFRRVSAVLGLDDEGMLGLAAERLPEPRFRRFCAEKAVALHGGLSILDAIFRLGPDALFGLMDVRNCGEIF